MRLLTSAATNSATYSQFHETSLHLKGLLREEFFAILGCDSCLIMKEPHSEFILSADERQIERIANWIERVRSTLYLERLPLKIAFSPVNTANDMRFDAPKEYRFLEIGDLWGKAWDYGWFRFTGQIPGNWKGKEVEGQIDLEGEISVFDLHGGIQRRLTWGSAFGLPCQVEDVPVLKCCNGGEEITLLAQAWASSIVGLDQPLDPAPEEPIKGGQHQALVNAAHLCTVCPEARALLWDAEVLLGVAKEAAPQSVRRAKAMGALVNACVVWQDNPSRAALAREQLQAELNRPATASSLEAVAIGHAHIDTGWLWRVEDSIGKCARTFASQAELIEKYPGYRFGSSSAQHYAFIKEHHPDLHRRVQDLVKAGHWELLGGMWVEPDTNLPSGESLIRQLLYGQQFFRQEFGVESQVAWLPDVFGHTAALPQILKKSGIRYLLGKKPHWSEVNRYPNTAFLWAGHDHSEILVHLLPQARDYNGLMRPQDLAAAERGFTEKADFEKFIYSVGIGDGGGGPSEVHLERALRMASLEGLPRVRFGETKEVFLAFEEGRQKLKKVRGDLYVEAHRGTFTTQARLKEHNRKQEIRLGQLEQLFCSLPPMDYPRQQFLRLWRTVLLHQFHDILPGSSIREVVEDTEQANERVFEELAQLQQQYGDRLPEEKESVTFFNALGHCWEGVVNNDHPLQAADAGIAYGSQIEPDGRVTTLVQLPPMQLADFKTTGAAVETKPLEEPVLENGELRCVFNENGMLVSVVDKKTGREFIPQSHPGNRLGLYVDRPQQWDAWEIDQTYPEQLLAPPTATAPWRGWSGPVRSVLIFTLQIGSSTLIQRCILSANSRRIDFETEVDWSERHRMLRVGFTSTHPATTGRCEIQHGFFDRPTHQNTPYEAARFEVPCHRYAALLDAVGGFAILNDCKYGVRIEEDFLELALLRSSSYPDHSADQGLHRFTYSYLPLASPAEFEEVPAIAANLNVLPISFEGRTSAGVRPPVQIQGDPVSLEALKRSEEGERLVLRIAEVHGKPAQIQIEGGGRWVLADLMERPLGELPAGGPIHLQPFEVVTLLGNS